MNPIIIHTDGSCETQTRLGGWAAVLQCGAHQRVLQGSATDTTVNAMELTAVIEALKALKQAGSAVQLFSDSNYVVRGVNEWLSDWLKRGWKNARGEQVANLDLWQQLQTLLEQHKVTLTWIPRGQNVQADELAQSARLTQISETTQKPLDDAGSVVDDNATAPTVLPQAVSEINILIAGSRYANREALDYARRVVRRVHQLGHTIVVGDNPKGVDMAVVQECRRLKAKVLVVGVTNNPRNGGCSHGNYVKVERDTYRAAGGHLFDRYHVRDRWMVDNAQRGVFVWNGDSKGTRAGYDYMMSRHKEAHLMTFALKERDMAETHILAIHTYSSQRVKLPGTNQMVSAYKIGYTSAACEVLLALYGSKARDVSSPHASYRYVQIDGETTVRHGYLLLNVTADELVQAEAVTRRYQRAAVYLWRDDRWLELPHGRNPAYSESAGRSGPGFNPSGFRPVVPSTGEKETAIEGIRAEKRQRDPNQKPWFWLLGDTYPQREILKRFGARFSSKKRAWYFVGWELPDGIKQLITEYVTTEPVATTTQVEDDAPCSEEEAAAILGVPVKSKLSAESPQPDEPARLFEIGQPVYARYELETPDGKAIPTGTQGTISRLYNRNAQHGWSYDVDFADIGVGWYFERELTDLRPIPGIRITHGTVVPPGAVLPPTDADLKRALVESGHQPEALVMNALSDEPESRPEPEMPEEPQPIRIFKPQSFPTDGTPLDEVQTAIVQAKTQLAPVLHPAVVSQKRTLAVIGQSYVGELTGSITGNVYCFGYAIHEGICVFVNMGGPRMAVEAIRAKLSKGDIVNCTPWDAPAIELTAGEGNSGMYHDYMQNIPEAKFTSLILCHDLLVNPNYGGKSTTFILRIDEAQVAAKLKHHITELVKVPVFDEWAGYLYHAGQTAMLVRQTRSAGDIDLLSVDLDIDAWTRLITGGIEQGVITLPIAN